MPEPLDPSPNPDARHADDASDRHTETATFAIGAGCSAEWVLTREPLEWPRTGGIISTRVGIATGINPDITSEAVEVVFDPDIITYKTLLSRFWTGHDGWRAPDPRQPMFADAIFAHSAEQRAEAEQVRDHFASTTYPHGSSEPAPVTSVLCDRAGFEVAPEREQRLIVRMTDALDDAYSDRTTPRATSAPASSDRAAEHEAALELRALAAQIGGCLDESSPGLDTRQPAFADQLVAALDHEPRRIRQLTSAMRDWLAVRPSAGLADGQCDVRIVEIGIASLDAESYLRFNRTESALHVIYSLRAGNARWQGGAYSSCRRALTDVDGVGRPVDTIEHLRAGRPAVPFGTLRTPRCFELDRDADAGQWHEHIPPAEMPVSCLNDTALHTVRWSQGQLETPDVAGTDAAGERTLSALGAPRCHCWTLVEMWDPRWIFQRFHDFPLTIGFMVRPSPWWSGASIEDRGPDWACKLPDVELSQARLQALSPTRRIWSRATRAALPSLDDALDHRFARQAPHDAKRAVRALVLSMLPRQSRSFQTRWLLTTLAWMTEHHDRLGPDDRTNYANLVFGHVEQPLLEALWQPCRYDPDVRMAAIQFHLLHPDERTTVTGTVQGDLVTIDVGVSFRWITQVWTRCLAVIDGHLVLDAGRQTDPHRVDVAVAQWDRDTGHAAGATLATRETTAHWDGTRWRLDRQPVVDEITHLAPK